MFNSIDEYLRKNAQDEIPEDDPGADPAPEEKDPTELAQENIIANMDKYKKSFEALFPSTQMNVTGI